MIKMVDNDGRACFILEPASLTNLHLGKGITLNLNELGLQGEVIVYFSPDILRFALKMQERKEKFKCIDEKWLQDEIRKSQTWEPIDRAAS